MLARKQVTIIKTEKRVSPELSLRLSDEFVSALLVLADDHGGWGRGGVAAVGPAQLLPAASRVLGVWRPVRAGLMRTRLEDTLRGRGWLLRPGRRLLDPGRGRGASLRSRSVMLVAISGVLLTLLHLGMFGALIFLQ